MFVTHIERILGKKPVGAPRELNDYFTKFQLDLLSKKFKIGYIIFYLLLNKNNTSCRFLLINVFMSALLSQPC